MVSDHHARRGPEAAIGGTEPLSLSGKPLVGAVWYLQVAAYRVLWRVLGASCVLVSRTVTA